MNTNRTIGCLLVTMLIVSCSLPDNKRCNGGFYWDKEEKTCWKADDEEDTGPEDTGDPEDAGNEANDTDEGAALPTGLGEVCEGDKDCEDLEADFCTNSPVEPIGYCTVKDCTAAPDNCPSGYQCCLFPMQGISDFCITPDEHVSMTAEGMCE